MKTHIRNRFQTAEIERSLARVLESKISAMKSNITLRRKPMTTEERMTMQEWQKQADYHREEQRRYRLAGTICGPQYTNASRF